MPPGDRRSVADSACGDASTVVPSVTAVPGCPSRAPRVERGPLERMSATLRLRTGPNFRFWRSGSTATHWITYARRIRPFPSPECRSRQDRAQPLDSLSKSPARSLPQASGHKHPLRGVVGIGGGCVDARSDVISRGGATAEGAIASDVSAIDSAHELALDNLAIARAMGRNRSWPPGRQAADCRVRAPPARIQALSTGHRSPL